MALNLANQEPWDYLPPEEIPGWGQVHGYILDDAVTRARHAYHTQGATQALVNYKAALVDLIAHPTWRSPDAWELLTFLQRQFLREYGKLMHQVVNVERASEVPAR